MDILLQVTDYEDMDIVWGGACCIALLVIFFVWLYICVWVYRDAEKRGSSGFLWALLVFVFGVIPLIIWLLVRPPLRQYGQNGYQNYGYMPPPPPPQQGQQFCPSCGKPMAYVPQYARWYCHNCGKYP